METPEVLMTGDGSTTLRVSSLDETYHSRHGALTESVHVYIKNGLYERIETGDLKSISIFEVGFGTGLNALLTILSCLSKKIELSYTTLEPFPLPKNLISQLNFTSLLKDTRASYWFDWIHDCNWNSVVKNEIVSFKKIKGKLENLETNEKFDLIYFDAFAPEKQPELWTAEIFGKMFSWMNELGILTTYCAKGQVKRDLISNGFLVENLPGPPGKRETIKATKPPQNS